MSASVDARSTRGRPLAGSQVTHAGRKVRIYRWIRSRLSTSEAESPGVSVRLGAAVSSSRSFSSSPSWCSRGLGSPCGASRSGAPKTTLATTTRRTGEGRSLPRRHVRYRALTSLVRRRVRLGDRLAAVLETLAFEQARRARTLGKLPVFLGLRPSVPDAVDLGLLRLLLPLLLLPEPVQFDDVAAHPVTLPRSTPPAPSCASCPSVADADAGGCGPRVTFA